MPYNISTEGMEELEQMLEQAGDAAQGAASAGLFEGAKVIADAVSGAVRGIATSPFKYAKGGKRQPSPEEKAILEAAPKGVAKFKKSGGSVDTSVGFSQSGYARITWNHARSGMRTKYKMGYGGMATASTSTEGKSTGISAKPIPVIANAINSGTSFMEKQPFFRKAVSQNRGKAQKAIEDKLLKMIEASMNKKNGGT